MSKKSWFKGTSKKVDLTPKAPRTMEEIQKAYAEEVARAGQTQYQVYVFTEDLKQINLRLLDINKEAARRQALDAQQAADKASTAPTGEANV